MKTFSHRSISGIILLPSSFHISIYLSVIHSLNCVFSSDTEGCIKLTFSESVSLSLKTRLMTLLNMPSEECLIVSRHYV